MPKQLGLIEFNYYLLHVINQLA